MLLLPGAITYHAMSTVEMADRVFHGIIFPLQWIFWYGLLARQKWAWAGLIILESSAILELIGHDACAVFHHHLWVCSSANWAISLFVDVVRIGIPLWILLTDKPSHWTEDSESPEPGLSKLHGKAEAASAALDGIISSEKPIERYETWTQENNQDNFSSNPESSD